MEKKKYTTEEIRLPKKSELNKTEKQLYNEKINNFIKQTKYRCDNENSLKNLLDFITAKTDILPAGKPDEYVSFDKIPEILAPYEKWTYIDRRIMLFITQEAWCFQQYHTFGNDFSEEGYYEYFYKWMKEQITNEKDDNLFFLIIEELKNYGKGRFAASDMDTLHKEIIKRNEELIKIIKLNYPEVSIQTKIEILQKAVDNLSQDTDEKIVVKGPLKTLTDILKQKPEKTDKPVIDEDQIIRHCLKELQDVLLTKDKKPTSAGKYLLSKFSEKIELMLKTTKDYIYQIKMIELFAIHKTEEFDKYLPEIFFKEKKKEKMFHAKFAKLELLCKCNAEKYEHYVLKSLEMINCQICKAELGRILKDYYADKYNETSFKTAEQTLNYISKKKKEDNKYEFFWSGGSRYEDGTQQFIEWILKSFGEKANDIIADYIENTK